ncbi:MAG: apolipoprotein N-acyltransferase, partial [Planctomycetaceae bacterium]
IVWPETMFRWPLLETPPGLTDQELQKAHPREPISYYRDPNIRKRLSDLAQMARAGLIVGLSGKEMDLEEVRNYNSAVLVQPDGTIERRYDKLHRVVFGEYVPLADSLPWLTKLTPYPEGFGLKAGSGVVAYESGGYRFAPIICFEDTVPHLVRAVVDLTAQTDAGTRREIDFLVNLTNDGWFRGSSEHEQHLITAKFRCIETRTPMVRAVNTGVSAIIDGDGRVRERSPITANAVVTGHVPLDPRESLYTKTGDLFGGACLASCGLLTLVGLFVRRKPALPGTLPTGPTTTI